MDVANPADSTNMPRWKIAAVQMDCTFADKTKNLDAIRARLGEAAENGAQLVIFPECAVPGYCYESKAEASNPSALEAAFPRVANYLSGHKDRMMYAAGLHCGAPIGSPRSEQTWKPLSRALRWILATLAKVTIGGE